MRPGRVASKKVPLAAGSQRCMESRSDRRQRRSAGGAAGMYAPFAAGTTGTPEELDRRGLTGRERRSDGSAPAEWP